MMKVFCLKDYGTWAKKGETVVVTNDTGIWAHRKGIDAIIKQYEKREKRRNKEWKIKKL